ncbi:MAG TPA: RluA family pseudouridine synthase [Vicinamibacterales bacterium]|nr:RluA family pseudouridine synthase [Vicinamibacterales bacterium]
MDWTVSAEDAGVRLDKFLAAGDRLGSRKRASVALDRAKVFVNDVEAPADAGATRLAAGDRVRVWMDRPGSSRSRTPVRSGDLHILYEDGSLIVLDKPAGLLAVPLERQEQADSVLDQLVAYLRPQGKRKPLVVHRIDRDTSGLVVFAKTVAAQRALREQFKRHTVQRIYRAVVYGHPDPPSAVWRDRLVWDQKALVQKATHPRDPKGKDAVCRYETLERFATASLIEVRLETGKRNQIRLQARLRGHTLVGERRYVYGPDELRPIVFPRQALHAFRLEFLHPATGAALRFEAGMPPDLVALLARLRRSA